MFVVFCLVFVLLFPSLSFQATPEQEYRKIQEKIVEQQKKIHEAQGRESSVLDELQSVNLSLTRIEKDLGQRRRQMKETESQITALNNKMAETSARLDRQKERMRKKLRAMYRFGSSADTLTVITNAGDLTQMMRLLKYLEVAADSDHATMEGYRQNLKDLDEQSQELQVLKRRLTEDTRRVTSKEDELASKKKTKEVLLSSVRGEKAAHTKMLNELREASKRLLDLIRESAKKDTYTGKGFGNRKGRLPWPVDGSIAIRYGSQRDPQFDTPVFRNGINFRAAADADTRSVYGGKVIYANWFKGFGQLVIINHGSGYHTLYGNLSEIFSHVGDIIKENQVIGKVGTSGTLNAPGLYFEVRYKGRPLDPAQWLKAKR